MSTNAASRGSSRRRPHTPKTGPTPRRGNKLPRGAHRGKNPLNSRIATVVVYLLTSLLMGVWALCMADFQSVMQEDDVLTATAEVQDVLSTGRVSRVEIAFTTQNGEKVVTETEEFYFTPWPQVGDLQEVRYHPEDPEYYVQDTRLGPDSFLVVLLGVFSFLFAVGAGVKALPWLQRLRPSSLV